MIINKIYIRSFGKLKDFELDLIDGINVIEGENESGKSTILSFIRFIFYGLPSRRGEEGALEHERAFSWDSGVADGYIDITTASGSFRIERRAVSSERGEGGVERASVTNLTSGSVVRNIKNIGEHFFSVPLSVFDSTCAIRQQSIAGISGGDLSASVENMLLSGDESTNTSRAIDKLGKAKRQLLPLRGAGGVINELTARRNELRRRLEEARESYKSVIALGGKVERSVALCAELRDKLNFAQDRLHAFETIQTLKRFEMLHAGEARIASLEAELSALTSRDGYNGKLPDREYARTLDSLSRRIANAAAELARARGELAGTRSAQIGDTNLAAHADDIDAAGGASSVADKYEQLRKSSVARAVWGVLLLVFGGLVMGGALGLYFARLLPFLTMPIASGISVGGLLILIIGITLLPSSSRARRRAAQYLYELGFEAEGKVQRTKIIAHAAACIEARRQINEFSALIGRLEQECQRKVEALEEERALAREALMLFGHSADDETLAAKLQEVAEAAIRTADEHEKLRRDIERYSASVRESAARLEGENEASLRAHLNPSAALMLETANLTSLKQETEEYAARLEVAIRARAEAEKNLAIRSGTTDNPARLAIELEEVELQLEQAEAKHAAIALAIEAITSASEAMRSNVTPRIRKEASSLLDAMTDGRYSDFSIDGEYSITLMTEGGTRSISTLSSGTRDAAYFALRSSLCRILYRGKTLPPMMLDEAMAQLDDGRARGLISILARLSQDTQIIIFTCHERERQLLSTTSIPHSFTLLKRQPSAKS